jgi:hypothetical protein
MHEPVGHTRQVGALAPDLGLTELDGVALVRNLALDQPVRLLVLEVEDGVLVLDRLNEHSLGVVGSRGHDDLQAGDVAEERLDRL